MSEITTKVNGNSSVTKRYGPGSGGNNRPELGRWIKITNSNSLRKRLIPKIVNIDDGLIKISGNSLDNDIVIKPEENKDYLDCRPDFDYWVKNIFRILDREKQWGHTNDAYEIAKQIREGQTKDFDPTLLKANICYWNNYCEEIKVSLKESRMLELKNWLNYLKVA